MADVNMRAMPHEVGSTACSEVTLSVIIVNWKTREMLVRCLKSLKETLPAASRADAHGPTQVSEAHSPELCLSPATVEIFVVDNASDDGSVEAVRQHFPSVHLVVNESNVGFAAANNQAIALARGRFVLLLNSDTEVLPGALETLVGFLNQRPQAGAAGPRLLNADGTLQPSCRPMLTPWREFWRLSFLDNFIHLSSYRAGDYNTSTPWQVDVIMGACLLLRRSALDQIGTLDSSYFMYTEEVDLCFRLAQAGWQCWWIPAAEVIHYGAASSRQAAQAMYLQLYRSKLQFYRKFGGRPRGWLFKFLLYLVYVPRLVVAASGAPFSRRLRREAHMFACLLAEMPAM